MNHRPLLSVVAVLPIVLGLCEPDPYSEPAQPTASGGSALVDMLDQVPAAVFDSEDAAILYYVDMSLVWERVGVGTDAQERLDNVGRTTLVETFSQTPQMFSLSVRQVDEARREVGFSTFEIDREIAVIAPPNQVIIAETTVPPEAVTAALESDPLWSADLREVTGEAGSYFAWGDDGLDHHFERVSAFRPLGQGGQLAVIGDPATVIRTLDAPDMVLTQQTSTGAAPSLADEGVLASAVEALDGEQVIQAIGVGQPTPTSSTGPNDSAASPTSLQHYEGILIAEVTDEGSVDTRILLPHATVEAAEANVHAVREALATGTDVVSNRPLAELLPDATADVNGTVVVVTIPGSGNYRTPVGMLFARALFPVG